MRIVYLTHQYLPRHIGGTEVYTHGLAVRAQRTGHAVHVITYVDSPSLDSTDYRAFHTQHDDIPVAEIHYNLSRAPHPSRAEYDNPVIAALLRHELEIIKPDLVHAVHVMKLSAAALEVCYSLYVPVVLTLADYWLICPRHTLLRWNQKLCEGSTHDLDCLRCLHETHGFADGLGQKFPAPLLRLGSRVGSKLLKNRLPRFWRDVRAIRERQNYLQQTAERADRVIALSQFQREMFVRNGYRAEKIEVLHHGLETEGLKAAKRTTTKEELEIVFIGSLVYHKGAHVLLKALAARPRLKVRLLVYGDASGSNPYLDSLKAMAAADQRVKLMGRFQPDEMGRVLETADVLAMPALWYENEPLVIKAARYVGLPVLASNIGTLAASIQQGAGILLPPGDVAAWAEAIEALKSETFAHVTPDKSIKSLDENARELMAIYEEVLLNRRCDAQTT